MLPGITVIMPSYLDMYPGCAMNRERKFIRAVDSFVAQDYKNKRLIIVSDGCEITSDIYRKRFSGILEVVLKEMAKQVLFSGDVRQAGLEECKSGIVCYLDTDDYFRLDTHLSIIATKMTELSADFVYYDELLGDGVRYDGVKEVSLKKGVAGTSSIAHSVIPGLSWSGCDGYGHDWLFIERLMRLSVNCKKITGTGYSICHTPNSFEC